MEKKGFLGSLFDFGFRGFVTLTIIRILYGIALFLVGIVTLLWVVLGFDQGAGYGILALLTSPLIFLLGALIARVELELTMVIFAMKEDLGEIRRGTRQGSTGEHDIPV